MSEHVYRVVVDDGPGEMVDHPDPEALGGTELETGAYIEPTVYAPAAGENPRRYRFLTERAAKRRVAWLESLGCRAHYEASAAIVWPDAAHRSGGSS